MYEDAELEALLDQGSCSMQEELACILGVTQQAIPHRLIINAQFLIKKTAETYL